MSKTNLRAAPALPLVNPTEAGQIALLLCRDGLLGELTQDRARSLLHNIEALPEAQRKPLRARMVKLLKARGNPQLKAAIVLTAPFAPYFEGFLEAHGDHHFSNLRSMFQDRVDPLDYLDTRGVSPEERRRALVAISGKTQKQKFSIISSIFTEAIHDDDATLIEDLAPVFPLDLEQVYSHLTSLAPWHRAPEALRDWCADLHDRTSMANPGLLSRLIEDAFNRSSLYLPACALLQGINIDAELERAAERRTSFCTWAKPLWDRQSNNHGQLILMAGLRALGSSRAIFATPEVRLQEILTGEVDVPLSDLTSP